MKHEFIKMNILSITTDKFPSDWQTLVIRSGIGGSNEPKYIVIYEDAIGNFHSQRMSKKILQDTHNIDEEDLLKLEDDKMKSFYNPDIISTRPVCPSCNNLSLTDKIEKYDNELYKTICTVCKAWILMDKRQKIIRIERENK